MLHDNDRVTVTPVIEVTLPGTELARRHPDNPYMTSNVGVIGKVEQANNGKNAVVRVGRVNLDGRSWSQTEFICLTPPERERVIAELAATRRYRPVPLRPSDVWRVLDSVVDDFVEDGPQSNRYSWGGTREEAEDKAAELNWADPDDTPPQPESLFERVLRLNHGDKVLAGIEVGRGLMRGDPEHFKAGYEREAAVLAVVELYGLNEAETAQVREGLPEEPDY